MAPHARTARFVTTFMMALVGGLLFFAFLYEDAVALGPERAVAEPRGLQIRYLIAMVLGGALSGWLLSGLYGRRGIGGYLLGFVGSIVALMVAGLFGSAVGLLPDILRQGWDASDLIPILFGAVALPLSFAGAPLLFVGWLVISLATHLWAKRVRGA
ncbi:hypothetical protein AYJ57_19560 [Salipiger sp. CCB-MM3]|uniref:hypothetical protein n=1 Tax=Salipiger sp. CCB-MM3 TaxID=1792508 RepID=UPI00080AAC44|nr:hypothetical protein [Salipiger sp. CCB-MM3]ANT62583.1 hypothetical protein AYJ57_19560 [Salipiger sp. CCB-MM3]